jgi:HPt (histidine-containing phosphotransfer) domain-containing protein
MSKHDCQAVNADAGADAVRSGAARDLAADEDARNRVADIADRARERNLGRADELAAWASIGEQGELSSEQRGEAAEIAHQLAGSAGTFGYLAATDVAREVEKLFSEADGAESWNRLTECVRDLVRRLREPPELSALD